MPWLSSLRLIGILLSYLAISLLQAPAHDVLDAEALRLVDAQRVGLSTDYETQNHSRQQQQYGSKWPARRRSVA